MRITLGGHTFDRVCKGAVFLPPGVSLSTPAPMKNIQQCIDACLACAVACEKCSAACLKEDNVKMMAGCIALDRDCADICFTTAALLARGSVHGEHLAKECREVCLACAAECEKHAAHHDHCKACAEACRKCAEACA